MLRHLLLFAMGNAIDAASCFVPSTKVTMADGSVQSLGDVQLGDWVMSWNEDKDMAVAAKVLSIIQSKRSDLMEVQCEKREQIISTRDHPYWSLKQNSLISADPVKTHSDYGLEVKTFLDEEILQAMDGSGVQCNVTSRHAETEARNVITLQLEGFHWYFAEGVRVHNKGSSGCFLLNSRVTMADKSIRPIGEISIGDLVMSWNEELGVATPAKVIQTKRALRSDLLTVKLESGEFITSTRDHPYWSLKQGNLVSADPVNTKLAYELEAKAFHDQDVLQAANGSAVQCKIVDLKDRDQEEEVMTLFLEEHHWFFVEGVRVHNKGASSGGRSSSSSRSGSSGSRAGYRVSSSGIYYSTYISYYPLYYSRSPYCRGNPAATQCATSDSGNIECGCQATSEDGTGFAKYCPPESLLGSCWLSGQNTSCVPTAPEMPKNDSRYLAAVSFCANEIANCTGTPDCEDEMAYYNFSNGALYWTNFTFEYPDNITDSFRALSQCMTSQINFCQCTWEICEEKTKTGMIVGIVIGSIFGLIAVFSVVFFCNKSRTKAKARPYHKKNSTCKHVFTSITCEELATRTGDKVYLEGFICDECYGSFRPNINPSHCFECKSDFCDGCLNKMGGGIQELPQYNEPKAVACLDNIEHAGSIETTTCREISDSSYADGFICDSCHGKFPNDVTFERCKIDHLDFCQGCSVRRTKPLQGGYLPPASAPPYSESSEQAPWEEPSKPQS